VLPYEKAAHLAPTPKHYYFVATIREKLKYAAESVDEQLQLGIEVCTVLFSL
jgi:hypothetical protein